MQAHRRWPVSGLGESSFSQPSQRASASGFDGKGGVQRHSISRPLRGQRRPGVPVFLASTSLLPVELRPQKSSLEHQQLRIVMSAALRKSLI